MYVAVACGRVLQVWILHCIYSDNREINCSNDFCNDAHWANDNIGQFDVDRPPLKDTVMIPNGGYAVVRIYTDNPGYWMAHCHQTEHLHEGWY